MLYLMYTAYIFGVMQRVFKKKVDDGVDVPAAASTQKEGKLNSLASEKQNTESFFSVNFLLF